MNKIILPIAMVIIIIAGIGGYFLLKGNYTAPSSNNYNPSPVQTPSTTPPENLTSNVSIKNFAFNPATLTIQKGTTVIWTNEDSVNHQIKSNTFNSNPLNQGSSFEFKFDQTGTYDYSCAIHPSMTGQIIVE